ncbi:MAG: transglycosylase SLT domain-containing protein [Endomicrobium sp.]|jgi:membrane-bound lytic murein transglycosylase D|nr:transglycosylase SLT domain-containing protein [Endomicrobium sp.]
MISCQFLYAQENDASYESNESKNYSDIIPISVEVDDPMFSQIAKAVSQAYSDEQTKSKILDAEIFYKKSTEAFKAGNLTDAKKYFILFLEEIGNAGIDPRIYFFLFDNMEEIITKLKRIYSANNSVSLSNERNYSISMTTKDNSLVEKYVSIYSSGKNKNIIQTALERSGTYRNIILKTLREFNLPEELFYLPVVESLYNLNTVSKAGAVGIWQIMAHRGRALGLQINYWIDERKDPEKATKAACLYLKQLYIMLNDWHLVLAAYNRGEYGLIRDMKFSNATNIYEMTLRNAIPKETQNYVPQFIAAVTIGDNLEEYGFRNLKYAEPLNYDKYKTNKVIDLKIAAQCAETSIEEIKKLNPALNAWCTPHGYPDFELKLPHGSKAKFIENIKKVKDLNPSPGFVKHKVTKGEYIEKIAAKYKTTTKEIYKDNPIISKQKYLKLGQVIVVRPGKNYF